MIPMMIKRMFIDSFRPAALSARTIFMPHQFERIAANVQATSRPMPGIAAIRS